MRYALAVEYDGAAFCGWQFQKHCVSVQEVVERALSIVADEPVQVVCSGRTDAGVHARAQVVHFDCSAERPDRAWLMGANANMQGRVAIHWGQRVADDFHARYSACGRRYRYVILNRVARPGLARGQVGWVYPRLDHEAMHAAAQALVGEFDFTSFRAAGCQARHAVREIFAIRVSREGDYVYVDIAANAFLHNMVRIIVGSLIRVGKGEAPVSWIGELLQLRDRTAGGVTAVPDGLYFLGAWYPERFGIPDFSQAVTTF
ncbi:tRNA pseudouridine(38-40) synthase TruA [Granulosicoccaceae sp. 1_MG-2023]|nr:tRNA pseudouridine(38-40) synthase TruA [Granulosicoccaceae sp. 1_MG-2023]